MFKAFAVIAVAIFQVKSHCQTPRHADLCEIVASAGDFNGQYISVHGNFEKGLEYTDLSTPNCKGVIAIRPTNASSNDPGLKAILAAHYCPPFRSKKKHISGDFVGRFEWERGRRPEWVLHVDRVSNVHLEIESCGVPDV
jgi:hypothetical protein